MKPSPVNSFFQTQPSRTIAAQFKGYAPKDILTQGTSSSSSDGFLMCMLKPIGRFFQSIFSFFKYLLCCGSSSYQLPKLTPQLLNQLFDEDSSGNFNYVQKSDYCIEIHDENEEPLHSLEIVPFGKSFGIQTKPLGKNDEWDEYLNEEAFFGSSAYIIKEIPEDKIEMAKENGFIKEGGLWVRKGPLEGVLSNVYEENLLVGFVKEDKTFEFIRIREEDGVYPVSGLENCPGRVNDFVTWATSMIDDEVTLEVASDPAINAELKEAGFVTTDGKTFTLELKKGE